MATLADQEFRARLAALGDKFAASVPVTMGRIAQALAACRAAEPAMPAPPQLEQLHDLLHGVAGSAGTFGFVVLGQQSRRIEQQLRTLMAGQADWPSAAAEVERLLAWAAEDARADHW